MFTRLRPAWPQINVTNATTGATIQTISTTHTLSAAWAPTPAAAAPATDPASLAPYTAATLSLAWTLGSTAAATALGLTTDTLAASATTGAPSNASVLLVPTGAGAGVSGVACATPLLTAPSTIASSTYREQLACSLPDSLPAGSYHAWVCLPAPYGCGYAPAAVLALPLTVASIDAASGSTAGGLAVTIAGSGFAADAASVGVLFGDVPCTVTAASRTAVTCTVGPLPANATAGQALPLSVTPSMVSPCSAPCPALACLPCSHARWRSHAPCAPCSGAAAGAGRVPAGEPQPAPPTHPPTPLLRHAHRRAPRRSNSRASPSPISPPRRPAWPLWPLHGAARRAAPPSPSRAASQQTPARPASRLAPRHAPMSFGWVHWLVVRAGRLLTHAAAILLHGCWWRGGDCSRRTLALLGLLQPPPQSARHVPLAAPTRWMQPPSPARPAPPRRPSPWVPSASL